MSLPVIPQGSNLYSTQGTTSSNLLNNAIRATRAPASTDYRGPSGNLLPGQVWVDTTTPSAYVLGSLTTSNGVTTANWLLTALNAGDLETLSGNTGTATPSSSNIAIVGTGDISTAASGSTVTISLTPGTTFISEIDGQAGTPVTPTAGGVVNIIGTANQLTSTGAADTLTFAFDTAWQSTPATVLGTPRFITSLGIGAGATATVFDVTSIGANALQANTATQSTAVGSQALFANTSGTGNTAVGFQALTSNVTSNNSTAVGNAALQSSLGADNTAVGFQAANANTSGTGNTAIGASSLIQNTTGTDNVAIGRVALSTSNASNLTAVGTGALQNNLNGIQLTAVGYTAGATNTTGGSNTYIGFQSGFSNSAGANNTAVGVGTLALATVSDLTAVGSQALTNCSTGGENTGIGATAGQTVSTGSQNTCVGFNSLGNVATGQNNTCIGHSSGTGLTLADSNNIMIGAATAGTAGDGNTLRIGAATGAGAGQLNRSFISGIRGITTGVADAVAVLVDSANQLGTVSSSIRFKENVKDLTLSERIYDLRPVTFKYKSQESSRPQYGLIAEEVDKVIPDIVVRDKEGQIETIQYQTLPIFLLAEIQKLKKEIEDLKAGR